jgi:phenylacetic acid degradation protein paaN
MATGKEMTRDLYDKHRSSLESAVAACRDRRYFSLFSETPDRHRGGADAQAAGRARHAAALGRSFDLEQLGTIGRAGAEVSPYTQQPLGIDYPRADPDALFAAGSRAMVGWAAASVETRLGVCMEIVDHLYERVFDTAQAVMHTAGQSSLMSYAGSGTNALDRGVEALAYAQMAMNNITPSARWERQFGSTLIPLQKTYRLVPRGVAVVFSCATFPTWNAYPAMLANLATGNPVIVKPHPTGVLPMAIAVRECREVLSASGFDPNLVTLCLDTLEEPLGKVLVKHPQTAIVDFTGSVRFGSWVEANAWPALCYSETSGVNTVVIDSVDDLDAVIKSLATTMSLFSAQMCTSPQNIYIPKSGIRTATGRVDAAEFGERLATAMKYLAADGKRAGAILAAIQSPSTLHLIDELQDRGAKTGRVLLESSSYVHGDFPQARTRTPLLVELEAGAAARALYGEERFGPIGFVIHCDDRDAALAHATTDAKQAGAITAFLYSTDEAYIERAEQAYSLAGAQLTINLTGPMPLNFAAAYSDYHVTGLNPAGNATLTDLAFVTSRFRITQSRRLVKDS